MRSIGKAFIFLLFLAFGLLFGGTRIAAFFSILAIAYISFSAILISDARHNLKMLFNFIPFKLGIIFMIYMVAQSYNVWLSFDPHGTYNTLVSYRFCVFLPASVNSGLRDVECIWTNFLGICLLIMTISALRMNLKNKNDCEFFSVIIFLSSAIISLIALCYKLYSPNLRMIWGIVDTGYATPYGSFFYKNQMGAYMILGGICGISSFLGAIGAHKKKRAIIYALALIVINLSIFASNSLGTLFIWILFLLTTFIYLFFLSFNGSNTRKRIFQILCIFIGFISVVIFSFTTKMDVKLCEKLKNLSDGNVSIIELSGNRNAFRMMTLEMIKHGGSQNGKFSSAELSRLIMGNGTNSFSYVSRIWNKKNFPELASYATTPDSLSINLLKYAHCDILQFIFEYGLLWSLILVIGFTYWIYKIMRRGAYFYPQVFTMVLGIVYILLYSYYDIILYNNVILSIFLSVGLLAYESSRYIAPQGVAK